MAKLVHWSTMGTSGESNNSHSQSFSSVVLKLKTAGSEGSSMSGSELFISLRGSVKIGSFGTLCPYMGAACFRELRLFEW
jgi:hypothetical protein